MCVADRASELARSLPYYPATVTSSDMPDMPSDQRFLPDTTARRSEAGLSFVELIVTVAILAVLASAALPFARFEAKREKERELHAALWTMRAAIDRYKDNADRGAFQTTVDSGNYPPDLYTLLYGVDVQGKKFKVLRRIQAYNRHAQSGGRSMHDDPNSDSLGGQNAFDVYSK